MEKWVDVKDNPAYEVSDCGRIRNKKTGRILKTNLNDKGYPILTLRKNNRQMTTNVHRVVAESFYDGDHYGLDVNHIDGNKTNNKLNNLEFCSRQENIQHAFRNGLKKPSRQIRIRVVETGEEFESIRACARAIGCDQSMICQYLHGTLKHCNGYHFEKV